MSEIWLPIEGYEGYYASNKGRVLSKCLRPMRATKRKRDGYMVLTLSQTNGKRRQMFVHRLIAMAFLGAIPPGMTVNHRNGDKGDNSLDNLEIVTLRQNIQHAFDTGIKKPRRGEQSPTAILTESQVREIKAEIANGAGNTELARRYGTTHSNISAIRRGLSWRHITLTFEVAS